MLAQSEGVQKRMEEVPDGWERSLIESEWASSFRKWFDTTRRGIGPYLQEQFKEVLRVFFYGLPPDSGKPRHWIGLENGVPWLEHALDELRELQTSLGGPIDRDRTSAPAASTPSTPHHGASWIYNPWVVGIGASAIVSLIILGITLLLT